MGGGWGKGRFSISGEFLVLWVLGIQFPWEGSYSMNEASASLGTIFLGTALVSLGFYGDGRRGIRSLIGGIHVSRAFLLSNGFHERYPVSWGEEVDVGCFHIPGV